MRDVLISGGGIAGLSTALALRATFGENFRIVVIDPAFGTREPNVRTSALAAGSCHLLDAIGVWRQIVNSAGPILSMNITDSRGNDSLRPLFLSFDKPLENGAPFAFMVRNADVVAALEQKARDENIEIRSTSVMRIIADSRSIEVRLSDGTAEQSHLVIGADGVQSRIRKSAGIETVSHDYARSAIVATLTHDEDHGGQATQHFLPSGPFAMLPMQGRRSAMVWSEYGADAPSYITLPHVEFLEEIERRFGYSLGRFEIEEGPSFFPLRVHLARSFIAPRVALIGDAAHLVHPLAGQGLNLGFRDIAALVESLASSVRLGLDPGEASALENYQRARFFDTASMVAATHGLHTLFSNDIGPLRLLRDLGMGIVDRMPRLKNKLMKDAAGLQGRVPSLLLGRLP